MGLEAPGKGQALLFLESSLQNSPITALIEVRGREKFWGAEFRSSYHLKLFQNIIKKKQERKGGCREPCVMRSGLPSSRQGERIVRSPQRTNPILLKKKGPKIPRVKGGEREGKNRSIRTALGWGR